MIGISTISLISAILLLFSIPVLLLMRIDRIIYCTLPFVLLSRHMPYLYVFSNGIIALVVIVVILKMGISNSARFIKPHFIFRNPFFYLSILLLITYLVSFFYNIHVSALAVEKHKEFLLSLFFVFIYGYLLISFVHTEQHLLGIAKVLLVILVINIVFAVASAFIGQAEYLGGFIRSQTIEAGSGADNAQRLGGLFFYWEAFSQYLAMTLIVLAVTLFRLRGLSRLFMVFLFFVGAVELLLTNSRGSVLVFGFGLILLIPFSRGISGSAARTVGLILLLCFLISVSIYIAEMSGLLNLEERFSLLTETVSTKYGDLPIGRAGAWVPALESTSGNLFTGHGPSFLPLTNHSGFSGKLPWPHNLILLIINTIGLIGLAIYSLMLAWVIRLLWSASRFSVDPLVTSIITGACIGWILFCLESMKFDGWLRAPDSWFYYVWILLAISYSLFNFRKNFIPQGNT